MESIKFEHQLNENEFVALLVFTTFGIKRFSRIIVLYITPILGVLFLSYFIIMKEVNFFNISISVVLIGLPPLFRFFFSVTCKKLYRKSSLMQMKSKMELLEDLIETEDEEGITKHYYTEISKVYESNKFFVIYLGKLQFVGINKNILEDSVCEKIRLKLQEEVGKKYIDRT